MSTKIKDTTLVDSVGQDYKIPVGNTGNDTTALSVSVGQLKTYTLNGLATVATTGAYSDLSGTPTIPAAQVNADWESNSGVSQILHKPTIPTVNNNTITFTQGGTSKGSFTLNQSSDTTIALDGSSFTQVQSDWNQSDNTQVDYIKNKPTIPSSSDFVTITNTNQTVNGIKTFSNPIQIDTTSNDGRFTIKLENLTVGTNPSTTQYVGFLSADSQGTQFANVNCSYSTAGVIGSNLYVNKTGIGSGSMGIYIDTANSTIYTKAPTPATNDDSTKIATTAFVKAQGYITLNSLNTQTLTFEDGQGNQTTITFYTTA